MMLINHLKTYLGKLKIARQIHELDTFTKKNDFIDRTLRDLQFHVFYKNFDATE